MKRSCLSLVPFIAFALAACGGQSCSCLQPIKGGFPTDARRHENALQVRVTQGALDYLSANGQALVSALLPSGSSFNIPSSCGGTNEICCLNGMPQMMCAMMITVQRLSLTPAPPNVLKLSVTTQLKSPNPIAVTINQLITAQCYFSIDTTKGTNGHQDVDLVSDVTFGVDSTTDLTNIALANTAVNNLDQSMLDITPQSGIGNLLACGAANIGFIKTFIIGQLKTTLSDQISQSVDSALCAKCTMPDDCDAFADACTDGLCMRQGKCLQEIGAAGKLDVGRLLASFSSNQSAQMDTLAVLGGYAEVTPQQASGLSLGLLGGGQGDPHNACVPMRPAPIPPMVPKWTAEMGEVEPVSMKPYHVGFGVHESHLNTMAWAAFDSGALCLDVGTPQVALLDARTLTVLMPSLSDLVHVSDAPAYLVMRPAQEPTIKIGAGTFDVDMSGNKVIKEPLLNITVPKFSIDFYAFIDDRYVRIMTLTGDLTIPASLDIDGMGQIVPVLGDLTKALTNATVTNSELLSESPAKLANAFPALLGVAVGQVGGAIKPFALPAVMGLNLQLVAIEPTDNLSFLSIFANISLSTMDAFHAETGATISRVLAPPTSAFSVESGLDPELAPRVELDLSGVGIDGSDRDLEWSVSFNQGATWSPYGQSRHPTVSDVTLWLQGRHRLLVRARMAGQPSTTDPTPVALDFVVDTVAPAGTIELDGGEARFRGHDAVSPPPELSYRYRIAGGAWSAWSREDHLAISGIDPTTLEAEALDEAGNAGSLNDFHGRTTAPAPSGCGCTLGARPPATRGLLAAGLVALFALLVRRRAAMVVLLAACGLCASACSHGLDRPVLGKDALIDPVDEVGRYSDAVSVSGTIHVSAYDDSLGDLAYAEVDLADVGKPIQWQWVDGVPLDSPPSNPGSYRKGITDPGDDIGEHTSIAVTSSGDPRIAYFDVTHGTLKYAAAGFYDRAFTTSVVDMVAAGRTGLYTSISLDDHAVPSIAYMATEIPDGMSGFVSRLRLATAKSASPAGPGDWTIVDVDQTPIPCAGLCAKGQACIQTDPMDATKKSTCKATDANPCPKMCATGEACIAAACVAYLAPVKAPDLPEGIGLFAQLRRLKSGKRAIGYYDREQGDLKLALENAPGSFTKSFIDGMDPLTDVGQFASMMVAPDDALHVAYIDAIGDRLLYKKVAGGVAPKTAELVDDGMRMDGPHPIGGSAALWTDGSKVRVLYQEQSTADLMQATRAGTSWTRSSLQTGGAGYGFYTHVVADGEQLFVSQFVYDRGHTDGNLGGLRISPLK